MAISFVMSIIAMFGTYIFMERQKPLRPRDVFPGLLFLAALVQLIVVVLLAADYHPDYDDVKYGRMASQK